METKEKKISSKSIENETPYKSADLKEIVEVFHQLFDQLGNDAQMSRELLDLDIKDSFSNLVSETLENPIKTSFEAYSAIEKAIIDLLNAHVITYLRSSEKEVKEVYKLKKSGNLLHYSIILKKNNLKNRSILNRFISEYGKTVYSTRFPIVLQDIPDSLVNEFRKIELIGNKYEKML
jgi:hypothetical protein